MTFIVRPAALADIRQMAEIAGSPVTPAGLADWMDGDSAYAAWHLVETERGRVLGFQHIGRSEALPAEACEIATFFGKTALPAGPPAACSTQPPGRRGCCALFGSRPHSPGTTMPHRPTTKAKASGAMATMKPAS